jgi:HEAT repeat protein
MVVDSQGDSEKTGRSSGGPLIAVAAVLLCCLLGAPQMARGQAPAAEPSRAIPLIVMPFENQTGDPSRDWLSYGLMDRLPFDRLRSFDTRTDMDWIPEPAQMNGITAEAVIELARRHASWGYVCWGEFAFRERNWTVSIHLADIATAKEVDLRQRAQISGKLEQISARLPVFAVSALKDALKIRVSPDEEGMVARQKPMALKSWKLVSDAYLYIKNIRPRLDEDTPERAQLIDETIGRFRKILAVDPSLNDCWAAIGWLEIIRGNGAAARDSFERAIRLAPAEIDAVAGMAVSYIGNQETRPDAEQGLVWLKRAMDINPSLSAYRIYLIPAFLLTKQVSNLVAEASRLSLSGFHDVRTIALEYIPAMRDPGAIPVLIRGLSDPWKEARLAAISGLGSYADSEAEDALLVLAASKEEEVDIRTAAISALTQATGARVLHVLAAGSEDPSKEIRVAAVEALSAMDSDSSIPILLAAFTEEDPDIKEAALQGLAWKGDTRVFPVLQAALHDRNPRLRLIAVEALSSSQVPGLQLLAQLSEAAADEDAEVRAGSMRQLSYLADPGSLPVFLQGIRDADEAVRTAALRGLGTLAGEEKRPEILTALTGALQDDSSEVREQAVDWLGSLDDPRALQALRKAAADPHGDVRAGAIRGLGWKLQPSDVETLLGAMSDPEGEVRLAAAGALAHGGDHETLSALLKLPAALEKDVQTNILSALAERYGSDNDEGPRISPQLVSYVLSAMQDADPETRIFALTALARIGYPEVEGVVSNAVNDASPEVRRTAINLQARSESCCDTSLLVKALRDDDESVRDAALRALGRSKEPEAVSRLLLLLLDDREDTRLESIVALSQKTDDRRVVASFLRLLAEDPSIQVRSYAASRLANCKQPEVTNALLQALSAETSIDVRTALAASLGRLGSESAVPALVGLLVEPNPELKEQAIEALGSIGDTGPVPELLRLAGSDAVSTRTAAIRALGSIKSAESVDALVELLQDSNIATRVAAVSALGSIADAQSVDALLQAVRDQNRDVMLQATRSLGGTEDPRRIGVLKELSDSPDPLVRAAAREALEPPAEKTGER